MDAGLALPGVTPPATPIDWTRLMLALAFVGLGIAGVMLIGRGAQGGRPLAS